MYYADWNCRACRTEIRISNVETRKAFNTNLDVELWTESLKSKYRNMKMMGVAFGFRDSDFGFE